MEKEPQMSNSDQESLKLVKQTLSVFFIAALALYAIGNLAMVLGTRLVGQSPLTPEVRAQFIHAAALNPKPLEHLIFLSVILSVVPILALVASGCGNP